jgi:hypothetical protein
MTSNTITQTKFHRFPLMSGLEIVACIAGLVSAFVAVGEAIRAFKRERKEKKLAIQLAAENAEMQLIKTLDEGPPRIQDEYERDLLRIGAAFQSGDGIPPLTRRC